MRLTLLTLLAATGATACAPIPNDSAVCGGLLGPVRALERALLAHPETPDAVGEAGTDAVIAYDAGCVRDRVWR